MYIHACMYIYIANRCRNANMDNRRLDTTTIAHRNPSPSNPTPLWASSVWGHLASLQSLWHLPPSSHSNPIQARQPARKQAKQLPRLQHPSLQGRSPRACRMSRSQGRAAVWNSSPSPNVCHKLPTGTDPLTHWLDEIQKSTKSAKSFQIPCDPSCDVRLHAMEHAWDWWEPLRIDAANRPIDEMNSDLQHLITSDPIYRKSRPPGPKPPGHRFWEVCGIRGSL